MSAASGSALAKRLAVHRHGTMTMRTSLLAQRHCQAIPSLILQSRTQGSRRNYAGMSKSRFVRHVQQSQKDSGKVYKSPTMSKMQSASKKSFFQNTGAPMMPDTLIPLPLAELPRNPTHFLQYQWWRAKIFFAQSLRNVTFKLESMPSWTKRPKFQLRKGQIVPTAKTMHRELMEAFAAGDKVAIQKLCYPDFASRFTSAIDRRNQREQTTFELKKYNQPMRYPRVCSLRTEKMDDLGPDILSNQAVVAIASTQAVSKVDRTTGALVPGSLKVQDMVEYLVLMREINEKTWEASEWRIWGTTAPSKYEEYGKQVEDYKKMTMASLKGKGDGGSP